MQTFVSTLIQIITEGRAPLRASGSDAERHVKQYVHPYLPGGASHAKGTHELTRDVGGLKAGSKVTLKAHSQNEKGVHHATFTQGRKSVTAPVSVLRKPGTVSNKGFEKEDALVGKLNQHGLMKGSGAGASGGNDFHLINKKTGQVHKGKQHEVVQGEVKNNLRAAFGQMSLHHDPAKGGWHISDKARNRQPTLAKHIESAKVNGKPLLEHLNSVHKGSGDFKEFKSDKTDLSPAHGYLKDHGVHVLHVGSHGTFRAGKGKDHTGAGLPVAKGEGQFRIRDKYKRGKSLVAQFNVKSLNKSHMSLENDDHLSHIKKALGH